MVVMTQIFQPGTPVIGSVYTTSMDMATGNALLGNTESMLGRAVSLPVHKEQISHPGGNVFLHDRFLSCSDGQAMVEKSLDAWPCWILREVISSMVPEGWGGPRQPARFN